MSGSNFKLVHSSSESYWKLVFLSSDLVSWFSALNSATDVKSLSSSDSDVSQMKTKTCWCLLDTSDDLQVFSYNSQCHCVMVFKRRNKLCFGIRIQSSAFFSICSQLVKCPLWATVAAQWKLDAVTGETVFQHLLVSDQKKQSSHHMFTACGSKTCHDSERADLTPTQSKKKVKYIFHLQKLPWNQITRIKTSPLEGGEMLFITMIIKEYMSVISHYCSSVIIHHLYNIETSTNSLNSTKNSSCDLI